MECSFNWKDCLGRVRTLNMTWNDTRFKCVFRSLETRRAVYTGDSRRRLHPLEKVIVRFGQGPEMVGEQIVRGCYSQQWEP